MNHRLMSIWVGARVSGSFIYLFQRRTIRNVDCVSHLLQIEQIANLLTQRDFSTLHHICLVIEAAGGRHLCTTSGGTTCGWRWSQLSSDRGYSKMSLYHCHYFMLPVIKTYCCDKDRGTALLKVRHLLVLTGLGRISALFLGKIVLRFRYW